MVTMRPMPAVSARATMASRSSAKSGKSRWQWLSTSMERSIYLSIDFGLDIAREHADRRRQRCARLDPGAECLEVARILGHAETVEHVYRSVWHHRLRQDRDLTHHFRGDIQHGLLPR